MRRFLLSPKGRKIHRWLGMTFGLYILAAAVSGISHNLMSAFFPPPPPARPAGEIHLAAASISPAQAAAAVSSPVQGINLRRIDNGLWYQVITPGSDTPRYVSAATGEPGDSMDAAYAADIAAQALPGQALTPGPRLTGFDDEYINIYRILPVYRFDADDGRGTRVYVSTLTGSVTFATTDARQAVAGFFSAVHKLNFIKHKTLKLIVLTILAVGAIVTILFGLMTAWARLSQTGHKA